MVDQLKQVANFGYIRHTHTLLGVQGMGGEEKVGARNPSDLLVFLSTGAEIRRLGFAASRVAIAVAHLGMGQNLTRNWTAGFSPRFHLNWGRLRIHVTLYQCLKLKQAIKYTFYTWAEV